MSFVCEIEADEARGEKPGWDEEEEEEEEVRGEGDAEGGDGNGGGGGGGGTFLRYFREALARFWFDKKPPFGSSLFTTASDLALVSSRQGVVGGLSGSLSSKS